MWKKNTGGVITWAGRKDTTSPSLNHIWAPRHHMRHFPFRGTNKRRNAIAEHRSISRNGSVKVPRLSSQQNSASSQCTELLLIQQHVVSIIFLNYHLVDDRCAAYGGRAHQQPDVTANTKLHRIKFQLKLVLTFIINLTLSESSNSWKVTWGCITIQD